MTEPSDLERIKALREKEQRDTALRLNFTAPTQLYARPKWALALDAIVARETAARDVSDSRWAAAAAEQVTRYNATHAADPKPEWLRLAHQEA